MGILRAKNLNKLLVGDLNNNFIFNKFELAQVILDTSVLNKVK